MFFHYVLKGLTLLNDKMSKSTATVVTTGNVALRKKLKSINNIISQRIAVFDYTLLYFEF